MNRTGLKIVLWLLFCAAIIFFCVMLGASGFGIPSDPDILFLRLDRVFAGFLVGAALTCAGVILQALLRNPLAEPYVLGVSSGAGAGAAVAIIAGFASFATFMVPLTAFVFAIFSVFLVFAFARMGGRLSIYTLILSGVIVSTVFSSLIIFLVSVASRDGLHSVMWWMLGNLQAPDTIALKVCATVTLTGTILAWLMAGRLNAMSLGEEIAHYVGVRTGLTVAAGVVIATIVTAVAVALAGIIGFVGLIVPHVVRIITGPDHKKLVPVAALTGGVFLALCDAIGRVVLLGFGPVEMPVGVMTAVIGGPVFLIILCKRRRSGWLE